MKKSNKFLLIGYIIALIALLVVVITARITLDKQYVLSLIPYDLISIIVPS